MPTLSPQHARTLAVQGHLRAGGALGRWLIRPMLPATIVAGLLSPRVGRRLLVSAAAGLGYLVVMDVRSARLANSPAAAVRMAAESLVARTLDDVAYSVGVWQGVLTQRTLEPVLPKVRDLPGRLISTVAPPCLTSRACAPLAGATWPEVDRSARQLLVLPLGSTEQHGPHLPLDTDTVIASHLAAALHAQFPQVGLAPAMPYGASGEHRDFPGTLSIGTEALTAVLVEFVRHASLDLAAVLVINGHGGNAAALAKAAELTRFEGRSLTVHHAASGGDRADPHAGYRETSLMLHLEPAAVRGRSAGRRQHRCTRGPAPAAADRRSQAGQRERCARRPDRRQRRGGPADLRDDARRSDGHGRAHCWTADLARAAGATPSDLSDRVGADSSELGFAATGSRRSVADTADRRRSRGPVRHRTLVARSRRPYRRGNPRAFRPLQSGCRRTRRRHHTGWSPSSATTRCSASTRPTVRR